MDLASAGTANRAPNFRAWMTARSASSAPEIERLAHHYVGDEGAEAIVQELFRGRSPTDLSVPELLELRIRFERLLAAPLGSAAARMIVEDHFTISKEEAQQLVISFEQMQQSLRVSEEEVRRGERLLASVVESVEARTHLADFLREREVTVMACCPTLLATIEQEPYFLTDASTAARNFASTFARRSTMA